MSYDDPRAAGGADRPAVSPHGSDFPPQLRPMEVGELLDEAFELYRRNFRLFFGITVLLDLPITMLQLRFAGPRGAFSWADGLALGASFITVAALTLAAWDRVQVRETTITLAYRQALRRSVPLFLGWLVFLLITAVVLVPWFVPGALMIRSSPELGPLVIFLGALVAFFPAMFLILWGMLLVPVIVVEGRGAGAFARCRKLAAGNLWRVFFLFMGLILVIVIYWTVLGGLLGLASAVTGTNALKPPDTGNRTELLVHAGFMLTSSMLQATWQPITVAACLLAYLDLRVRREAYDLELLTRGVEARAAARQQPATAGLEGGAFYSSPGTTGQGAS